jgi:hypothetical protein
MAYTLPMLLIADARYLTTTVSWTSSWAVKIFFVKTVSNEFWEDFADTLLSNQKTGPSKHATNMEDKVGKK